MSQQSYHWLFATFFGTNRKSRVPFALAHMSPPDVSEEYRSNRGIGKLTSDEVKAVDEQLLALSSRVRFKVKHFADKSYGWTEPHNGPEGRRGCRCTIWIGHTLYNTVGQEHRPDERALLDFVLAITILHELAHAAHHHIMGMRFEDFFEDTLIAEAGFDYINRIFGMQPSIFPETLSNPLWECWQTLPFLNPASYPLQDFCRNISELPKERVRYPFDPQSARQLLDDAWWEAKVDRSIDLIPSFLLQQENSRLFQLMPSSLQRWLQGTDVETGHAELKLREIAPPDTQPPEVDEYRQDLLQIQRAR